MGLESAIQQDGQKLYGDLHTAPKPERRLCNQDTYALEWIIPHCPPSESTFFRQVLADTQRLLAAELLQADPFLDAMLRHRMGRQFRSRPDRQRGKLAIEQWVPAMDCWMVNGYFDKDKPYGFIIDTLEAGDPRKKTAEEDLEDRREAAAEKRQANEKDGEQKVLAAVDSLTNRQVENFVAVEQALRTGENITVRGQDRNTIERLVDDTKKAAFSGDAEAQAVYTRGQRDNPTCILPTTNPLRHRHRKELQGQGG
jgi:hypothetical protein